MLESYFTKSIDTPLINDPWPHQIIEKHIEESQFKILQEDCQQLLNIKTDKLFYVLPRDFKKHNINWYDQIYEISRKLLDNVKQLVEVYPKYRWWGDHVIHSYIGVTPPKPYEFKIHYETGAKIWSSVTYVTPATNAGTKLYTENSKDAFVKAVEWKPTSTFNFCGQDNQTWHSYNSTEESNRITLNFFIKQRYKTKEYFLD